MEDAGLVVREDVMGNIFGRWQGSNASAGARPCRRCQLPSRTAAKPRLLFCHPHATLQPVPDLRQVAACAR